MRPDVAFWFSFSFHMVFLVASLTLRPSFKIYGAWSSQYFPSCYCPQLTSPQVSLCIRYRLTRWQTADWLAKSSYRKTPKEEESHERWNQKIVSGQHQHKQRSWKLNLPESETEEHWKREGEQHTQWFFSSGSSISSRKHWKATCEELASKDWG